MVFTLSGRGQKNASAGAEFLGFAGENPYDAETNPSGKISLGPADNFLIHSELAEFVNSKITISEHAFGYGDGSSGSNRVRKAMAKHVNQYFLPCKPVLAEQVVFSSGVTAINEIVTWNITDPGDGILLGKPIYRDFRVDLTAKSGAELLYVCMEGVDYFSSGAIEKYELSMQNAEQRGIRVRVLWLCNPHNPLGQCYSTKVLQEYMQFCRKYNLHLVSDEIYALSVFNSTAPPVPFTSVLSIESAGLIDPEYLHVLYGMSKVFYPPLETPLPEANLPLKDFGAAGLRLGCLITRSKQLLSAFSVLSRFAWPSNLSCEVAATMLEDTEWTAWLLDLNRQRLAENYAITTEVLERAGIEYYKGVNAGYFLWINLSPYLPSGPADPTTRERLLTKRLLDAGICLSTGENFSSEQAGWFRIVFTYEKGQLREGLRRIVETVREIEQERGSARDGGIPE